MGIVFREQTLPNGLTIVGELDADAHTFAAGYFVRTGARDEAPGVMGVSHFLEHMMFKGTDSISAEELNRRFDDMGARNNAYTSSELTCFYAQVLPEFARSAMDLLGRMMRPALRQPDFDTEKGVILEEIAMYKDDPFWVLYEEAVQRHYRDHPLGYRVLGTNESITDLTSQQMHAYFAERYSSDNAVLAVAGRCSFDEVIDSAERVTASWTPTEATRDNARPPTGAGEFTMRQSNVTRGYLIGLSPGPAVDDDRKYAMSLLTQILGAPDNSLLHWELIETGIAEQAQAGFSAHDGTGDLYVFASGDPDRLDAIWEVMRAQCVKVAQAAREDDLERLRNKVVTAATLAGERPGDRMQRLGRCQTTLGRYVSLDEELQRIAAVTLADVRRVAEEFPPIPTTVGRLIPG